MLWGCSSAGRAPALQAGGQEFDSPHLHHLEVFSFKTNFLSVLRINIRGDIEKLRLKSKIQSKSYVMNL